MGSAGSLYSLVWRFARIQCDDIHNTNPRTGDQSTYRGSAQDNVLDENPMEATGVWPQKYGLDNDGEQQSYEVVRKQLEQEHLRKYLNWMSYPK